MFTTLDKSNYLKGLLLIAKLDGQLFEAEKNFIREIASRLGFSKDFYEETLKYLLVNDYIDSKPVEFSDQEVAVLFINDGLELAYSDEEFSPNEEQYLRETAQVNDIDTELFNDIHRHYLSFRKASQRAERKEVV